MATQSVTSPQLARAGIGAAGDEGGGQGERACQIIAAANALLERDGLEGLTIRAVLRDTGLSRRAFYERFEGKDDLVLAVFEQAIRFAADLYGGQAAALVDPIRRLETIVTGIVLGRAAIEGHAVEPADRIGAAMSREHHRLAESRPADLQAALDPLMRLITRQLSDGMAAGVVRVTDPERLATLVYNLVSTTVHTELLAREAERPDPARRSQLAAEIWEFCRRAIAADMKES